LELGLASSESNWSLKSKYDEFGGKRVAPPGKEKCLMWSPRWARGGLMLIAERRMKLRGKNPGQEAPTGFEERISSGPAHSCCAAPNGVRGNKPGMQ